MPASGRLLQVTVKSADATVDPGSMIRVLLSLAMVPIVLMAADTFAATLYMLNGGVPAPRSADYQPPCRLGACANYRPDNVVTGWFTTAEPLPANLNRVDIFPRLVGFGFADGVSVHASVNPESRVQSFIVSTNSSGRVTVERLWLVTWTSGRRPHAPGDRLNSLMLAGGYAVAQNNDQCSGVSSQHGLGVETGIDDACPLVKPDVSSSVAETNGCTIGGAPGCSPAPAAWMQESLAVSTPLPVPTLSTALLGLLGAVLAAIAARSFPAIPPRQRSGAGTTPAGFLRRAAPSTTSPSRRAGIARTLRASSS